MSGHSRAGSGALRALLLGSVALGLAVPVQAAETSDIDALERQMQILMQELQDLKAKQGRQQQEIEQQKQEIEAQEEQIEQQKEQIEAQSGTVTPAPAQAVTGGAHPGSFKLPGSDTSMKIGGYVKADLFYDVNADTGNSFNTTSIPADGSPGDDREGSFRAQARQSRINLTTWTPTGVGEVKTFVEGDFLGSTGNEVFSNSTSFRLRHAYGQLSTETYDVLFGQTWTNFMPLTSYPDTVDFFGPTGIPFIRQGQARVTYKGIENFKISVSAENSEFTGRSAAGTVGSETSGDFKFAIDSIPDFTGAVEYNKDGWNLKVAGLARRFELDSAGLDDKEFGWGVFVGGVAPTFGDDSLQANFTYGEGVGRYLINGGTQDAFVKAGGELEAITQWGLAVGYTHHWSDTLYSNVVYGRNEFDDTFDPGDFETLQTVHVNTWWQPADNVRFGLEWIYGMAEFDNGSLDNDANRIQFGAQYFF